MANQPKISPVVRVAPMGELRVYPITEGELDELERGSPASIHLNFALFFWGSAISLFASVVAAPGLSIRPFTVLVVFLCGCSIAALVFTVLWFLNHRIAGSVAKRIRDRMPPAPAIQEPMSASTDPRPGLSPVRAKADEEV